MSAARPQAGIWLKHIDQRHKFCCSDNPLELEPGSVARTPDQVSLDPPDMRQADNHAFTAAELRSIARGIVLRHEAMGRNVHDVKRYIATLPVLTHHPIIDGVTR